MKRKIALLTLVLLVAVSIAACGGSKSKEITAKSLLEDVQAMTKDKKSMESHMTMSMEMSGEDLEALGGSTEVKMDMDMKTVIDSVANYMNGKMSMAGMDMDVEAYTVLEGDQICSYTNSMGMWLVQKYTYDKTAVEALDSSSQAMLDNIESLVLEEETKDVDGREAYIIKGTITGESIKSMLSSAGSVIEGFVGMSDDMDVSNMSIDLEYAIAKDDETPLYIDYVFNGMEDLTGTEGTSIDKMTMNLKYVGFDTVDEISVPEDVKNGAVDISGLYTDQTESELSEGQ